MLASITDEANDLVSTAARRIAGVLAGSIVILVLAVLAWLAIARSIARPLLMLQADAQDVANNRLPFAVERLRTADAGTPITLPPEPVAVTSRDEIGQVARAFHGVHQQAIQLATDQAVLRRGTSTQCSSTSRGAANLSWSGFSGRSTDSNNGSKIRISLKPVSVSTISRLECAETMKACSCSLVVKLRAFKNKAVPLPEIVLASISEIEDFALVRQQSLAPIEVPGHAVSDVVHLLAELLENATRFSPPGSPSQVTARGSREVPRR